MAKKMAHLNVATANY